MDNAWAFEGTVVVLGVVAVLAAVVFYQGYFISRISNIVFGRPGGGWSPFGWLDGGYFKLLAEVKRIKREHDEMARDLCEARNKQIALCKRTEASSPFRLFYEPSKTVSADFPYVRQVASETHDGKDVYLFAVADGTGKGIAAGLPMVVLRGVLDACATVLAWDTDAARTVSLMLLARAANEAFRSVNHSATAIIGCACGAVVQYVNFGHPYPVVTRRGADPVVVLKPPQFFSLGDEDPSAFADVTPECVVLMPSESFVVYTDGATETSVNGNVVGRTGLLEYIRREGSGTAGVARIVEYAKGSGRDDTVAMEFVPLSA